MASQVGYANRSPVKRPEWHSLIAWDMFFNNLTTGIFLVAAICELVRPEVFRAPAKWAFPLALIFLTIDLACLVLDLGDPLRFHHMLRVFKPTSPMSLGTWCLTVYSLPLTLVVAIDVLPAQWAGRFGWLRWLCLIGGLLPALGSAIYKGVLISTSSQPGWKDARWLGGYLANSALLVGTASLLLLSFRTGPVKATSILRIAFGILIALNTIPLVLLAIELRGSLLGLHNRNTWVGLGTLILGGGVLLPIAMIFPTNSAVMGIVAAILVFAASLLVRFLLVKLPHSEP